MVEEKEGAVVMWGMGKMNQVSGSQVCGDGESSLRSHAHTRICRTSRDSQVIYVRAMNFSF
jgi:hypothetical protein